MFTRRGMAAIFSASLPDSLQLAAIQDEGGIEGFEGGKFVGDPVTAGEKLIIFRRSVLIVDRRLFSHLPQHMIQRQFRAQGIPVEPLVGRDQKHPIPTDQIANLLEHSSPLPAGSP